MARDGASVSLSLLGTFQVILDGEPVTAFESDKVRALLAYLAVESDRPHRRETLACLLWPERPEGSARRNLSQALFNLRRVIGDHDATPPFLLITRQTLQFNPSSDYQLDVTTFTESLAACEKHRHPRLEACEPCMERLQQAAALWRGSFLTGFSLGDSPAFEEWSVREGERLHRLAMEALRRLVGCHQARGEYELALQYTRRWVELDPWREPAHRQLMRLLASSGQRGAALAQYETCRRLLLEELGVEPGGKTTQLYEQIRDGELRVWEPGRREDRPMAPPAFLVGKETVEVERPVFVTRQRELTQLGEFLDSALAGQGRVVFVIGDAGQGKTALIQEFARRAQAAHLDLGVAGGNGRAHVGIGDPYLPFREILGLLTGDVEARWAAGAMPREQVRRLWHTLPLAVQALVEDGPDLIDLFVPGVALVKRAAAFTPWPGEADWLPRLEELVERKAAIPGDPNLQQSGLFEQYTRVLEALARQRPLLLILDDLQWADAGSTSLLFHLGRRIEGSRILIVGAYRPAEVALGRPASPLLAGGIEGGRERHPLAPLVNEFKRDFGDIEVALDQDGDRPFVDAFLDTEPNRLGAAFRETLYRQTRGHPLFTIELLRGMEERGDLVQDKAGRWVEGPALDWETLPARVEAVIAERISCLTRPSRAILRVASVEGETFTAEVVARVRAADEGEMVEHLSDELDRRRRLVRAQGIQRLGEGRLSHYRFRHILFQKYLYHSLDPVERAHLHERVGTALETLHGEETDEITAIALQLARHFQEGGIPEKAVAYLLQAGKRAARMSAHQEAIAHLRRGLELLETLPDTPKRTQQELALQIALGVSLQAIQGYVAPEVGRTYARARELCQQVGETPQLFPVLVLLVAFYGTRGEHQTAHEIGEQLLHLAENVEGPVFVTAHVTMGWNLLFLGAFAQAQAHLEQAIAFYDPGQHHSLAFLYGQDFGVVCLSITSWALWLLGYPEQALKRSQEAMALAQELSHPFSTAIAQFFAAIFHTFCRDVQMVQEWAEACINLCTKHGFPFWLGGGTIFRGWALVEQGPAEVGLGQMHQGMSVYQATGAQLAHPQQLALLAEAYGKVGQVEEGLTTLAEALAIAHRNEERFYEAEIHRLKGELLRMRGEVEAEIEACYHKAIEVARQQSARSWELRAVMSLCRLWQEQGKRKEARQRLAEIYGWFTEGFDTSDLKEARALLEELSNP